MPYNEWVATQEALERAERQIDAIRVLAKIEEDNSCEDTAELARDILEIIGRDSGA